MVGLRYVPRLILIILALFIVSCDSFYDRLYTSSAIVVTNNSQLTVSELYISVADLESWGSNRLSEAITPGGSVIIEDLSKTIINVLIVFESGVERIVADIDLSSVEIFEIELLPD